MLIQNFELEKRLDDWTLDAETLADMFDVKAVSAGDGTIVNTGPHSIQLGDGLFRAEFYYRKGKMTHIKLMPKIDGVKDPGYPSKKYEAAKCEYCTAILKQLYGNKYIPTPIGIQYETTNYIIGCYVKRKGKNKYGGGNIIISMR